MNGDIKEKVVYDLGCGNGILSIGAKILGASYVVGVDIDRDALKIAKENAERMGVEIKLICSDIEKLTLRKANTVIENPPFGSHVKGTDIKFLKKAVEIGEVTYSLHISKTREFIRKTVESMNCRVDRVYPLSIKIKRRYRFHRKSFIDVEADLFRIVKGEGDES